MRTPIGTMTMSALLASLAAGCVVEVQSNSDAVSFSEEISAVVINTDAGDVHVVGADMVGAEVYRTLEWAGSRAPQVDAWVSGDVLYVEARCPTAALRCSVEHELVVPAGATVEVTTGSGGVLTRGVRGAWVETGSGDVELTNIAGRAWVDTGSGSVTLQNIDGEASLSTGSGDITGQGLEGARVDAGTGSGSVTLQLGDALEGVDVSTGSGDVDLEVPSGSYTLDINTGSGDIRLDGVRHEASAPRWIEVDTGSGDVRVAARSS